MGRKKVGDGPGEGGGAAGGDTLVNPGEAAISGGLAPMPGGLASMPGAAAMPGAMPGGLASLPGAAAMPGPAAMPGAAAMPGGGGNPAEAMNMMQMQMQAMQHMQAMMKAGSLPDMQAMMAGKGAASPPMMAARGNESVEAPKPAPSQNIPAAFRNMHKGQNNPPSSASSSGMPSMAANMAANRAAAPAVVSMAPNPALANMAAANPALAQAAMAAQAAEAARQEQAAAAAAKAAAIADQSKSVDAGAMSLEGMQDMLAAGAEFNPMLAMMMKQQAIIQAQFASAEKERKTEQADEPANDMLKDPDILEFFDHFQIDTRHHSRFCGIMAKRLETFDGDMIKLWQLCERARSAEGMFVSKIREMEEGTFVGKTVPDKALKEMSRKFKLDTEAESLLSDVLAKYDKVKRAQYMDDLEKHLEVSARPSAMVMMSLKKIGNGEPLGKAGRPAPGCYLERMRQQENKSRSRSRRRSRSRGGGGGGRRDYDRRDRDSGGKDRRDYDRDRGRD